MASGGGEGSSSSDAVPDQPFIMRVADFGMGIAFSAQALLWKSLANSKAVAEHVGAVPESIGTMVWWMAVVVLSGLGGAYGAKAWRYPWAVRLEYRDPVRSYFFFGILLAVLLLVLAAPKRLYEGGQGGREAAFFAGMVMDLALRLDAAAAWLYGQDRTMRRVSPTIMLSCINGFVGGNLGAQLGHRELARFFFAQSAIIYLAVLFSMFQSLSAGAKPGNIWPLPRELTPTLFLIVAPPNAAALSWSVIVGGFGELSRACFYLGCFLLLLHVRCLAIFAKAPFSIAWWAYTFPLTTVPLAAIEWANLFEGGAGKAAAVLAVVAAGVSVSVVALVLVRVSAAVWSYRAGNSLAGLWAGMTSPHALALCPNDPLLVSARREHEAARDQNELRARSLPAHDAI